MKVFTRIEEALKRIEAMLTPAEPIPRQFLVAYTWENDITGKTGHSSSIINVKPNVRINAKKIRELQADLLELISQEGHANDPTHVVILNIVKLES